MVVALARLACQRAVLFCRQGKPGYPNCLPMLDMALATVPRKWRGAMLAVVAHTDHCNAPLLGRPTADRGTRDE